MAIILDGKMLAEKIRNEAAAACAALSRKPVLATVLVGEDPASQVYVRSKTKDCEKCGIESRGINLPAETTQEQLLALIAELNGDDSVDGILVQMPVPAHIDARAVIEAISPEKDVDGFHPVNVGRLNAGEDSLLPCTPAGVMEFFKEYGISIDGKICVVVGRSNIVGKPMSSLLLQANGTVITCHSRTPDLAAMTRQADILVAAAGKRGMISTDMVKPGAVVIDVSINRSEDGSLCGDVLFDEVSEKASYITPVPGGVGPVTRAMLMKNVLKAAGKRG